MLSLVSRSQPQRKHWPNIFHAISLAKGMYDKLYLQCIIDTEYAECHRI